MGCCCSQPKFDFITRRILLELGLSNYEVKKLLKLFRKVDADGNGVIQADEFFEFFDLQPSLVNKLLFSCYDIEENGEMTFIQFVCTLWSFFTLQIEEIGAFVFFIFDLKKTGEVPYTEVPNITKQIHKRYYEESANLKTLVTKMVKGPGGKRREGLLSAKAFEKWSGANPDICRPVVGKQKDMLSKGLGNGFWKIVTVKKNKAGKLGNIYHMYNFMKKIGGDRDVFNRVKKLSPEEQAEADRKAEIAAKVAAAAADKAKKVENYKKKNSKPILETSEGHQVSYYNVDDIDNLMDNFIVREESIKSTKKRGGSGKSKNNNKKTLPPIVSKKGMQISDSDNDFGSLTKTKELPPLVLKALQKGHLSSATIAPMDNCRISDAARKVVQKERESGPLSAEEKKRIFAAKAGRSNKKMSSEKDIFH